ncbi:AbaSI family restriction endonuclease [Marinilactibacillus kalidii]|uniref:AbaSI family restriction endonuclease n=1 Tax=Marinilactibacillus kalidii TaxID=2820274 RepID=UPI001ABDC800|nr:hypothetical protein [Marinilactibacillus kalidii]
MDKVTYLIKTFSRTKRKDYENYILNALWQRIDCLNIRPVTQQYVRVSADKYYLIDLFFPQINMGIEVDEAFHKKTIESDLKRVLTMEQKLSAVREDRLFEVKRIDATLPLQALTERIQDVAEEIKAKIIAYDIKKWDTDVSVKEWIEKNGFLSIDDFYRFRLITDVANQLFFKKYKGYQQAGFNMTVADKSVEVWFPTISTGEKEEHNQWLNYLDDSWCVLTEKNIRQDGKAAYHDVGELRIVFAKIRDHFGKFSYRYIGNFKLDSISADLKIRKYTKISEKVYIDYKKETITI